MPCDLPLELRRAIGKYVDCQYRYRGGRSRGFSGDCESDLHDDLRGSGSHELGSGVHRTVFSFKDRKKKDCVVKVATGRYGDVSGEEANLTEANYYNDLPTYSRRWFWPVYHAEPRGWWITGPEVDTSSGVSDEDFDEILSQTGCQDVHGANVGYFRRRPVLLDYGFEGASCGMEPPMHSPTRKQPLRPLPAYALRRAGRLFR